VTLLGNMVQAIEVVDDAQSPLGWALVAARVLSYFSALVVVVLAARQFRQANSELRVVTPGIRSAIGVVGISALAVLVLKASFDAGRSWSQLFDTVVLADAITSPVGIVVFVQVLVVLTWLFLAKAKKHSRLWRAGAVISVIALVCAFVADGAGLSTPSNDYQKFSVSLVEADVVGDFTVAPTRVGSSEVHLYFSPPGGLLSPMQNVTLEFVEVQSNSARDVSLVVSGPNHWLGIAEFGTPGQYSMTVRAITAQNVAVQYVTNLVINP
jgi:hypothetical protein